MVMYGYGLVLVISYSIIIPFQRILIKLLKNQVYVYESVVILSIVALGLAGSFGYYKSSIINGEYSFKQFVLKIYLPTIAVFIPLLVVGRWWINTKHKLPKSREIIFSEKQKAYQLTPKIKEAMDSKVYLNTELQLQEFASQLEVSAKQLSQSINIGFGQNFNDFINNYRIAEVVRAIQNGNHQKHTLHGIAENCGFNSKATFNRAFRKKMGTSPREYIKLIDSTPVKE